jgi:hypothetical protein
MMREALGERRTPAPTYVPNEQRGERMNQFVFASIGPEGPWERVRTPEGARGNETGRRRAETEPTYMRKLGRGFNEFDVKAFLFQRNRGNQPGNATPHDQYT